MRTLQHVVLCVGHEIYSQDILECIKICVVHANRFVREVAYNLIEALFQVCQDVENCKDIFEVSVPELCKGLSDSWPQVRFTACQGSRTFLLLI